MFHIGDKIVYPMHGAGVIEAIEDREVFGHVGSYYRMRLPFDEMTVMIPTEEAGNLGIRSIITDREADQVMDYFKNYVEEVTANWNKRYRENVMRIKSGDIYEVSQVVKVLMSREKQRGLSSGERKMLSSAKQIMLSELVLAKDMEQKVLEEELEALLL